MSKFTKEHANYIRNINSNNRLDYLDSSFRSRMGKLIDPLIALDAKRYFELAKELNLCTCDLCGIVIGNADRRGTGLCDCCWELHSRLSSRKFQLWAAMKRGQATLKELVEDIQQLRGELAKEPVDG
jgi:hypothetical protein